MKVTILQFPGTNCEYDTQHAFEQLGASTEIVWHKNESIPEDTDLLVVAGGFSYGDYLRSGAIAAKSNILNEVIKAANDGCLVLGICNGFQILTETGLLKGVLLRNKNLKFLGKDIHVKAINTDNKFCNKYKKDQS